MLQHIEEWNIPTHSFTAAVRVSNAMGELTAEEYGERVARLTNKSLRDSDHPRFTYLYMIQEAVRSHGKLNGEELFDIAAEKSGKFVKENGWMEVAKAATKKVDASGNPKKPKGDKKAAAVKLWNERKDENLSRKEWITLLVEEVGLTEAGASTYHANLKSGRYK